MERNNLSLRLLELCAMIESRNDHSEGEISGFFLSPYGEYISIPNDSEHSDYVRENPGRFGITHVDLRDFDSEPYELAVDKGWMVIRKWKGSPKAGLRSYWSVLMKRMNKNSKRAVERWADYILKDRPQEESVTVVFETVEEGQIFPDLTIGQITTGHMDTA